MMRRPFANSIRDQALARSPNWFPTNSTATHKARHPQAFPMRFHRNGRFVGVDMFIEQVDKTLLERNDLDGNGALFKMFNSLTHSVNRSYNFYRNDNTKRTREWDPTWDLDELVAGVDEDNPDRDRYVMDNVNVPAMINYLAATVVSGDYDHETHNYFVYRDNEGTGRWEFIPWDRNIALITAANDPTAHPFLGSSEYVHQPWACLEGKCDEQWNRLTDAIYDNPVTREMYLRRLRTLMDDLLQPPSTPTAERKLETRLDELSALLQSDDANLASSARSLKSIVAARRDHLYVTHGVNNLFSDPVDLIPEFAPVSYFSPGDDSLGNNVDNHYVRRQCLVAGRDRSGIRKHASVIHSAAENRGLARFPEKRHVDLRTYVVQRG